MSLLFNTLLLATLAAIITVSSTHEQGQTVNTSFKSAPLTLVSPPLLSHYLSTYILIARLPSGEAAQDHSQHSILSTDGGAQRRGWERRKGREGRERWKRWDKGRGGRISWTKGGTRRDRTTRPSGGQRNARNAGTNRTFWSSWGERREG